MKKQLVPCLCLMVLVACNKSSGGGNPVTPTPPSSNRSPVVNSMSIAPTFGIAFLTTFNFSASASDPDGDAVTYNWNIAGNSVTGQAGQLVFSTGGNGAATVTVTDGKGGSATDTRTFTVGTLTGTWDVVAPFCDARPFTLTLTQSGGIATGSFLFPNQWCNVVAGTPGVTDPAEPGLITPAGKVDIRLKVGSFLDFYLRGDMATTGRTITGGMFNSGFTGQPFTATKR